MCLINAFNAWIKPLYHANSLWFSLSHGHYNKSWMESYPEGAESVVFRADVGRQLNLTARGINMHCDDQYHSIRATLCIWAVSGYAADLRIILPQGMIKWLIVSMMTRKWCLLWKKNKMSEAILKLIILLSDILTLLWPSSDWSLFTCCELEP